MSKNKNCTSFTKDLQFISNLNLKQYQHWPATSNWLFTWLQWTCQCCQVHKDKICQIVFQNMPNRTKICQIFFVTKKHLENRQ